MKKMSVLILGLCGVIFSGLHGETTSQHFLSFTMPCYNCSKTVQKSIDSIYEQNITIPFEVVCTDDGSTDGTVAILQDYEKKYENFHVYFHEENLGGGAASNTCVKFAKGDLLFRLDSDNVLSPDSIDKLIALLDETGCDGATVEELRFHNGDFQETSHWTYQAKDNICDIEHCITTTIDPAASGNYLFTRKSFEKAGGYPTERSGADTFCFGLRQYATGSKIAILPNSFYWHFTNPDGYWNREQRTGRNQKIAYQGLLQFKEIFSSATQNRLASGNNSYADEINGGNLKLADARILTCLFQGYDFEYIKEYEKAVSQFEKAVRYGCNSYKIKEKIRSLKKLIRNKEKYQ